MLLARPGGRQRCTAVAGRRGVGRRLAGRTSSGSLAVARISTDAEPGPEEDMGSLSGRSVMG